MNYDRLLPIIFLRNGKCRSSRLQKMYNHKIRYKNILEYLNNRYEDSFSIPETIHRMLLNIEHHKKCPICGKYVGFNRGKFGDVCSIQCLPKYREEKTKQTCLKKYGVEYACASKQAIEKRKRTLVERYGVEVPCKSKEIKDKLEKTCIEKFGVNTYFKTKEFKEKSKISLLKRYGVDNAAYLDKTIINSHNIEACNKRNSTKRKNHTFNTSSTEDNIYELLSQYYEVKRNWNKDPRYPWMCDFYIEEIDLFIECNFHWTHGGHPFDQSSIKDQVKLEQWKAKQTKYYDNAIDTWTKRDVKKRNKAKEENLNYVELWSYKEAVKYINENLLK